MSGRELSLDQFYSSLEPRRFLGEIRNIVTERLEAELLENRIVHHVYENPLPSQSRETRFSFFLIILSFFFAFSSIFLVLNGSIKEGESLKLNTTMLQSTEGKLIEALTMKAGNDKVYIEKLFTQYQERVDKRKRASEAGSEEMIQIPARIAAEEHTGRETPPAVLAERKVQKLIEQKMTDMIEEAAAKIETAKAHDQTGQEAAVQDTSELHPDAHFPVGMSLDQTAIEAVRPEAAEVVRKITFENRREVAALENILRSLSMQAEERAASNAVIYDLLSTKITLKEVIGSDSVKKTHPGLYSSIDLFFQYYGEVYSELGRKRALDEISSELRGVFQNSEP